MLFRMLFGMLTVFSMIFWLTSCNKGNYGGGQQPSGNPGQTGFNPSGQNTNTTQSSTNPSCKAWGGVTCQGGSTQSFKDFVSKGTFLEHIGDISCTPSNDGGMLIRMQVALNGSFNPSGNNQNLVMQIASSEFEFVLFDSLDQAPISGKLEGVSGEVNGNQANLHFAHNSENGRADVRVQGTFDVNTFSGTIHFANEKLVVDDQGNHSNDGRSGILGDFRIATCAVFSY